jgi:hypothetical protein
MNCRSDAVNLIPYTRADVWNERPAGNGVRAAAWTPLRLVTHRDIGHIAADRATAAALRTVYASIGAARSAV